MSTQAPTYPFKFNVGHRVTHVKSQKTYSVVGLPNVYRIEATGEPAYAYMADGVIWVRGQAETEDGRFALTDDLVEVGRYGAGRFGRESLTELVRGDLIPLEVGLPPFEVPAVSPVDTNHTPPKTKRARGENPFFQRQDEFGRSEEGDGYALPVGQDIAQANSQAAEALVREFPIGASGRRLVDARWPQLPAGQDDTHDEQINVVGSITAKQAERVTPYPSHLFERVEDAVPVGPKPSAGQILRTIPAIFNAAHRS